MIRIEDQNIASEMKKLIAEYEPLLKKFLGEDNITFEVGNIPTDVINQ